MKFLLWGTVAIVSQSWRQSALGLLVIRMPHDDKCLTGHTRTGTMSTPFQKDTHATAFQLKGGAGRGGLLSPCVWYILNSVSGEKESRGALKHPFQRWDCFSLLHWQTVLFVLRLHLSSCLTKAKPLKVDRGFVDWTIPHYDQISFKCLLHIVRRRSNNCSRKAISAEISLIMKPAQFPLLPWMEGAALGQAGGRNTFGHFSVLELNRSH